MADPQEKEESLRRKEDLLRREIEDLERQQLDLAEKMEQIAGIDCAFGTCVFDKNIDSVELKLEDVQRRKRAIESMMKSLTELKPE